MMVSNPVRFFGGGSAGAADDQVAEPLASRSSSTSP